MDQTQGKRKRQNEEDFQKHEIQRWIGFGLQNKQKRLIKLSHM